MRISDVPESSAMKRERPMPTGARKVPLCFSAASMKMQKTSSAVKNISMNSPCTMLEPPPRVVDTFSGPGKSAETTAAEAIEPKICDINTRPPRVQLTAPIRHMPRVT